MKFSLFIALATALCSYTPALAQLPTYDITTLPSPKHPEFPKSDYLDSTIHQIPGGYVWEYRLRSYRSNAVNEVITKLSKTYLYSYSDGMEGPSTSLIVEDALPDNAMIEDKVFEDDRLYVLWSQYDKATKVAGVHERAYQLPDLTQKCADVELGAIEVHDFHSKTSDDLGLSLFNNENHEQMIMCHSRSVEDRSKETIVTIGVDANLTATSHNTYTISSLEGLALRGTFTDDGELLMFTEPNVFSTKAKDAVESSFSLVRIGKSGIEQVPLSFLQGKIPICMHLHSHDGVGRLTGLFIRKEGSADVEGYFAVDIDPLSRFDQALIHTFSAPVEDFLRNNGLDFVQLTERADGGFFMTGISDRPAAGSIHKMLLAISVGPGLKHEWYVELPRRIFSFEVIPDYFALQLDGHLTLLFEDIPENLAHYRTGEELQVAKKNFVWLAATFSEEGKPQFERFNIDKEGFEAKRLYSTSNDHTFLFSMKEKKPKDILRPMGTYEKVHFKQ